MPSIASISTFALLSFLLIIVPGPSVIFVLSRSIALGRRSGLLSVVGNAAGFSVLILLVAAGLGPVLQQSATLFSAMKFLGAAYLVGWVSRRFDTAMRRRRSQMPLRWARVFDGYSPKASSSVSPTPRR